MYFLLKICQLSLQDVFVIENFRRCISYGKWTQLDNLGSTVYGTEVMGWVNFGQGRGGKFGKPTSEVE